MEWVDWDKTDGIYSAAPTGCVDGGASIGMNDFNETINACSDGSGTTEVYPLGGYTSSQSFGQWYGGISGATVRGGHWISFTAAGAFMLDLSTGSAALFLTGFRCVYRP
jgi:hypothetical protein